MWFSKCVPWHFTYKNWKLMYTWKPAHDVYSSFIHICQNLEATKMSFSRWIDKLWYIQMMEYPVIKRDELSSHEKTLRKFTCILLKIKEANLIRLYDSNCITFWKRYSYGDSESISGCQGFRVRKRWLDEPQRIFQGSENTLCDTTVMDTCYYTFFSNP